MKNLKIITTAVIFFMLGSGASVYFVNNVEKNREEFKRRIAEKQQGDERNKLVIALKEIDFDSSGLEGINDFYADINENETIKKIWPDYKDKLAVVLNDGLKKEGVNIVSDAFDANGVPIVPDFLYLSINVIRDERSGMIAGSAELYLNGIFVDHKIKKFVSADRWKKTRAFMVKENEAAKQLEEITRTLMNDFIGDYLKSNPEKKNTASSDVANE